VLPWRPALQFSRGGLMIAPAADCCTRWQALRRMTP